MSTVYAESQPGELPEDDSIRDLAPGDELIFDPDALEDDRGLPRHTVMVGNIGLILPHEEVSELIEKVSVCGLPNTRAWFAGITSIRGNMIPVFDLHELFAIERPAAGRRLIAVGENRTAAAFWVDYFPRLLVFADDELTTSEPPIPPLIREHARRYFLQDEQTWVEWDCKAFFAALGEQL